MPPSECTGLSNGGFGFSSTNDVCTKTNMLSTQTSASSPSMPMLSSPDLASPSAKFSDPASPSYAQANHASSRLHSSDLPTSPVAQLTLAHAASLLLPTDDVTSPLGLRNIASMKTVTKSTTILAHSESMTTAFDQNDSKSLMRVPGVSGFIRGRGVSVILPMPPQRNRERK